MYVTRWPGAAANAASASKTSGCPITQRRTLSRAISSVTSVSNRPRYGTFRRSRKSPAITISTSASANSPPA
ncbi:MAG: hypothetical protein FJ087_20675 [Deltaproteobacteria bacterium]|nr:hypothetical protein [Deltaproteobacteria bacterium]